MLLTGNETVCISVTVKQATQATLKQAKGETSHH